VNAKARARLASDPILNEMFLLSVDGHLPALVPSGTELRTTASNLNGLFSTVYWVAQAWPVIEVRQNAAA
jgi:hypothetical protein